MTKPRGIRNNNPGNIRWGDPWQGLVPVGDRKDKDFCQFTAPTYGIRAIARTLITYQDKYEVKTVRQAINRWAPPQENATSAYVNAVAARMGVNADKELDFQDYASLRPLLESIIRQENGDGGLGGINTWYEDRVIRKGLALAGVEPSDKTVAKAPMTKETFGAAATAGVGVSQLAEAAPAIADALSSTQDSLTSGQVSRVVVGAVLLGLAVFIALSQIKRHKEGTLQ